MRRTIQINNLTCEYFYADSQQVAYILTPMSLNDKDVEALTAKYNINLIVISGMDWNDDMTPWSAPGITRGEKDFGNNAEAFLATLTNKIIPEAEANFALNPTARILAGISLSGMFALWAWFKSDVFSTIISISGSLWYPDFADWFCKHPLSASVATHSLGLSASIPAMGARAVVTVQLSMAAMSVLLPLPPVTA